MKNDAGETNDTIAFLSQSGALEDGLRLGGAGVWRWKIDSNQLEWSRNLESVHHLPPGSFDGTLSSFQRDLHPDDAECVWRKIMASIETGAPYRAVYRTAPRPEQPEIWIETAGGIAIGVDGSKYLTGICMDVSDRVRNERQLERRLAQQRAVARFGSFALNESDLQKIMDRAVQVAADVLAVPLTKILQFSDGADDLILRAGTGWAEGLVGHATVGVERASQAGYTLLSKDPVIVEDLLAETRFNGPKLLHDHKVRSGMSVVIPGPEARPFGVFGIHARDIRDFDSTDAEFLQSLANIVAGAARRVATTNHQILLVREMAHRAGNMLQLVKSIANQTFDTNADMRLARESFGERLSALARSNYVVSRGGWKSTRFAELVEETLQPFGNRVEAEGRDVLLQPELCFDMGLVLHELSTNSAKYGALGSSDGAIKVKWAFRQTPEHSRVFCFDWEDPLPASTQAPGGGTGFGTKLMRALIERKWNGRLSITDAPRFRMSAEIPVAN